MSTHDNSETLCNVFVRDWWRDAEKHEAGWPNNLVPFGGAPKRYLARDVTESEAREMCREYNESHDPGRYSRKAEYEQA